MFVCGSCLFAYHNWYGLCLKASFVLFYDGMFERFVNVMYIVCYVYCYDIPCVDVSGVLTLYELAASPSLL